MEARQDKEERQENMTERQEERNTERHGDRKTGYQKDLNTGRQKDRKSGRLEHKKTGRQKGRKTRIQEVKHGTDPCPTPYYLDRIPTPKRLQNMPFIAYGGAQPSAWLEFLLSSVQLDTESVTF